MRPGPLPVLPTTVIGSYSVPDWLERLKTDYHRGHLSGTQLESVHDVAVKAALKDQEIAGIDIVTDGELRRDNDIDYVLGRLPGVQVAGPGKSFYYDYYDAEVVSQLPVDEPAPIGLAEDFRFARRQTDRLLKVSFTGPFSLSRRLRDSHYGDERELVLALARVLHAEAVGLAAAGATMIQIDEPYLAGHPDSVRLAVEAVNLVTGGVDVEWGLHVCYGNRYARPSWEGHYDFLFPAVLDADVDQLLLEFARKGYQDLEVVARGGWDRTLGLGVIDVKSRQVESPETVESRIRRAVDVLGIEHLVVNPDCGLRHLPADVARAKLAGMVEASRAVRGSVPSPAPVSSGPPASGPASSEPAPSEPASSDLGATP
jgi:5-methyltetrahydropteroyltriglutamate--homocysteine methyltransferase